MASSLVGASMKRPPPNKVITGTETIIYLPNGEKVMTFLLENRVFVNKNHERAWHFAVAGIPVARCRYNHTPQIIREEAITDKETINGWWQSDPGAKVVICPKNRCYKVIVPSGACPPKPLSETF